MGYITNCDFINYDGKLEKDINLNVYNEDIVIKLCNVSPYVIL